MHFKMTYLGVLLSFCKWWNDEMMKNNNREAVTQVGLTHEEQRSWEALGLGKGLRMSLQPPRPLFLADEFKQDMVIACLQHYPDHKSLHKKNGKAIRWEDSSLLYVSVCVWKREILSEKKTKSVFNTMKEYMCRIEKLKAKLNWKSDLKKKHMIIS